MTYLSINSCSQYTIQSKVNILHYLIFLRRTLKCQELNYQKTQIECIDYLTPEIIMTSYHSSSLVPFINLCIHVGQSPLLIHFKQQPLETFFPVFGFWGGVFQCFFVMFSLRQSWEAALAINILTSLFLLFINTHHIFPNAFIIQKFLLNYFFR